MKVTVNLKQLYELKRDLYNQIKRHVDGRIYGTETIDVGIAFADAITRFQEANPIELWEEEQKQAEHAAAKARAEKDEAEAAERVKFWFTCGLIPNQHNATTLRKIIAEKMEGAINAFNIDVCMNRFRDQFHWKQVETPPPPPPPPPPVLLADGSEQLPLGTTPRSRHSVLQLRDLDKRTREANNAAVRAANNEVALAFRNAAAQSAPLEVL